MADALKDWSGLGEDFLCMIGQRLMTPEDVIRSRAVCNAWRRALLPEQQRRILPFTQWLMLPYCTSNNMNMDMTIFSTITDSPASAMPMIGCKGSESCRCFYDVALHKFHHFEFPQGLHSKSCRGSSMGWLCMVGKTPAISLWNPLTRTEIPLPPITAFPDVLRYNPGKARLEYLIQADGCTISTGKRFIEERYIRRVAISAEPTSEECIVMAIRWQHIDDCLAFCRPTEIEAGWKYVSEEQDGIRQDMLGYVDVVFWRNRFYILTDGGRVLVCDFSANPHHPTLSFLLDFPPRRFVYPEANSLYLVISPAAVTGDDDDQLMMVARHTKLMECERRPYQPNTDDDDDDDHHHHTNCPDSDSDDDQLGNGATKLYYTDVFKVFKMNGGASGWDEVKSIGDFALFLGFDSSSTFVSTKVHPQLIPNSIYFTDDFPYPNRDQRHAGHDMGIYDLATRTIKPLYSTTSLHNNPLMISPVPVWFAPSTVVTRS